MLVAALPPPIARLVTCRFAPGGVAQLVERLTGSQEVRGFESPRLHPKAKVRGIVPGGLEEGEASGTHLGTHMVPTTAPPGPFGGRPKIGCRGDALCVRSGCRWSPLADGDGAPRAGVQRTWPPSPASPREGGEHIDEPAVVVVGWDPPQRLGCQRASTGPTRARGMRSTLAKTRARTSTSPRRTPSSASAEGRRSAPVRGSGQEKPTGRRRQPVSVSPAAEPWSRRPSHSSPSAATVRRPAGSSPQGSGGPAPTASAPKAVSQTW